MYVKGGCPVLQLLKWGPPCPTSCPKTGYLAEALHLCSLGEQGDSRGYVTLLILCPQQGLLAVTALQPDGCFQKWQSVLLLFLYPASWHQDICSPGAQQHSELVLNDISSYELFVSSSKNHQKWNNSLIPILTKVNVIFFICMEYYFGHVLEISPARELVAFPLGEGCRRCFCQMT